MKLLAIAVAASALSLAACSSSNSDAVENADLNQPAMEDLNQAASDAASDANAESLGDQMNQLNSTAPAENTQSPSDAQEQNVAGM